MTDPAVTAHHNNRAAFISQLDRRERTYQQPDIGPCYCGCPIDAHDDTRCHHCNCDGYIEHTAVTAYRDALDTDDQFTGRRRNNTTAAIDLARRTRP